MAAKSRRARVVELLAETSAALAHSHEMLARTHQLMFDLVDSEDPPVAPTPPQEKRPRRPFLREWRTYASFRQDMVRREREALRQFEPPIKKHQLANQTGYDGVRTIERTIRDYHLDPDVHWPPSTWPEEEPDSGPAQFGHNAAMLAAGLGSFLLLDVMSDGKMDGVIHFVRVVCRGFSGLT